MANLAARTVFETEARGRKSFIIKDAITLYEGCLVMLNAGYADHWVDTGSADMFLGLCLGGDDHAGTNDGDLTGDTDNTNGAPRAYVDTSGVTLKGLTVGGTPGPTKVGDLVYCEDSNPANITLDSSGQTHPIGWMSDYRSSTDQDVTLFTPEEHLAQATA